MPAADVDDGVAVPWAVVRGPAATGRAGGALGGSRAGRPQESHPPRTTADHSACYCLLPGSGASHDSSASELAMSRAGPSILARQHGPCNRSTQTQSSFKHFQTFILCEFEFDLAQSTRHTPCALHPPSCAGQSRRRRCHHPLALLHCQHHRAAGLIRTPAPRAVAVAASGLLAPRTAAARCRHTMPLHAAATYMGWV